MVAGIASTRLRRSSKRGLTTLGLDESAAILAGHLDEQLRTGIIDTPDRSWFGRSRRTKPPSPSTTKS